jgi:HD superfamily phosphohydrolase
MDKQRSEKTLSGEEINKLKANFVKLLSNPIVSFENLSAKIDIEQEASHLANLWIKNPNLQNYQLDQFINAGGQGMVFKAYEKENKGTRALKIIRKHGFESPKEETFPGITEKLSPVSKSELRALNKIAHPNVVRLYEAISDSEDNKFVIAISTTFVNNPQGIDNYLKIVLKRASKINNPLSPRRLEDACEFLIERCKEIASALEHMHSQRMYHFDIKPANILISKEDAKEVTGYKAMLTDMGSCIHTDSIKTPFRVYYTWSYAHTELTNLTAEPTGLRGGGVKASSAVPKKEGIEKFDLFAFGRTIQELLAIIESEFGERCYSSYSFRYLHLISCLLLDGENSPGRHQITERDGRRFVNDVALDYPIEVFQASKIISSAELVERFNRFGSYFSLDVLAQEFDPWQPNITNSVVHSPAPFTYRVSLILNHRCFRRLKNELQLGWIREVYPGATHDRWSHSLGTFSAAVSYYRSILSDPEVPTLRVIVKKPDISNALLAALLHDLGQTSFAHDFEESSPKLFSHVQLIEKLLDEKYWGEPTLRTTIKNNWGDGVDLVRVLNILKKDSLEMESAPKHEILIDSLASDIINGPIDADKLDYLKRDSIACGVPYAHGIDVDRFLQAITVTARRSGKGARLNLAFRSKGRAAMTSLLLARYQMYNSVYWHHTFRCIKAMLSHAIQNTFGKLHEESAEYRGNIVSSQTIKDLFYHYVVCKKNFKECLKEITDSNDNKAFSELLRKRKPIEDKAIEFLWIFSDDKTRALLKYLIKRQLYKRVFELRVGELGGAIDYSTMKNEFSSPKRVEKAIEIQDLFFKAIDSTMKSRKDKKNYEETATGAYADDRLAKLKQKNDQLILIDFPTKGVPQEKNVPKEISDAIRKYFVLTSTKKPKEDSPFFTICKLQENLATLRIFAHKDLHELIIRYLSPKEVQDVISHAIHIIKDD